VEEKVERKLREENLHENDVFLTEDNSSSPHDCDRRNPVALRQPHTVEKRPIIDRKSSEHMKPKLSQITRILSSSVDETLLVIREMSPITRVVIFPEGRVTKQKHCRQRENTFDQFSMILIWKENRLKIESARDDNYGVLG
jgi:hypothetical protein